MMKKRLNRPLRCWQLNMQHSMASSSYYSKLLIKSSESTVAMIQEPYYTRAGKVSFGKGIGVMSCGDKPRACIAYKNIELCYCSFLSSRDVVTCIGKWSGMDIYLVSAYFDGTVDKIPDALTKTLETVAKRGAELILCVDANAHSTAWASKSTDRREAHGRVHDVFLRATTSKSGRQVYI